MKTKVGVGMRFFGLVLTCAAAIAGCAPNTGLLVRFPIGSVTRGREAFVALDCHACHRIDGIDLPPPADSSRISVLLGGHTPRIETYGDIVTAIVNPSHRVSRRFTPETADRRSPMSAEFINEVMTAQQLIDIAAFLRIEYDYIPPPASPYFDSYSEDGIGPNDLRVPRAGR